MSQPTLEQLKAAAFDADRLVEVYKERSKQLRQAILQKEQAEKEEKPKKK